jgi:hypothetical protein
MKEVGGICINQQRASGKQIVLQLSCLAFDYCFESLPSNFQSLPP